MSEENNGISKEEYLASLAESGIAGTDPAPLSSEMVSEQAQVKSQQMAAESDVVEEASKIEEPKEEERVEKGEEEAPVEAIESEQASEEEKSEDASENVEFAEIDSDKVYKIKVDGQEIEISGADLKSKASGEIAVEKRFNEVDKIKKAWQADKEADLQERAALKQKIEKGQIWEALADIIDTPGYVLKENLLNQLAPELERRSRMTQDQVQAEKLLDERKYYKDSYESEIARRQEEQHAEALRRQEAEQVALNQEILDVRETHKISDSEWETAFKELDSSIPKDQDITIDMVKDHVLNSVRSVESAPEVNFTAMTDKALEPYKQHINNDYRQKLLDFVKLTPDLTEQQLSDIVKASIKQGLEQQLLGDNPSNSEPETKQDRLKRLQEEALSNAVGNTDTSKNWF